VLFSRGRSGIPALSVDIEVSADDVVTIDGRDDGRILDTRGETGRFIRARLVILAFGLRAKTISGVDSIDLRGGDAGGVGRSALNLSPLGDASFPMPTRVLDDDAVDGGVME